MKSEIKKNRQYRSGLKKVVILGSGPIVIGQACEFDYSGTQACKALMKEGLEVILINSNPATIMTDPDIATRVYIEPLKFDFVKKILEKEKPDALIPTLGGQTALNLALELYDSGCLQELDIKLLGAHPNSIRAAEDREKFCRLLDSIGARYPKSKMIRTFDQALECVESLGLPLVLRPNFTLGGGGGGIAYSLEEFKTKVALALHESPTTEVLVEESILGWSEFELEVMRDRVGTFVVICSIENLDPCGVHTGDSITVAPQQTLSDREYQAMRDEAKKIIEAVGIETGGANIQFAVHPTTRERYVIEMNPRVSRSSALASKATGFPIAKIAALLALGYTLDQLKNDITGTTPSSYEPALDYVVTKIPRFAFEKFPGVKDVLSTQMKSVGEAMGIGRTFKESFLKALVSLEKNPQGLPDVLFDEKELAQPSSVRIEQVAQAFREGLAVEKVYELTQIHPWFLEQIEAIVQAEKKIKQAPAMDADLLRQAKKTGFSDARIAKLRNVTELEIYKLRHQLNVRPRYLQVDTCAAEFESSTPYFYSTYWYDENFSDGPVLKTAQPQIVVLGSGPNRIGQGIEFDYSCVRGVRRLQKEGYQVIMINSNPETVSTDYDTSDELYFEPLVNEYVLEVMHRVQPFGYIAQLGGQTPIHLMPRLQQEGFTVLGSSQHTIDKAEDRKLFNQICQQLQLKIPRSGMAHDFDSALAIAQSLGYPLLCRPSYVLGGRRMEIIENQDELKSYFVRHEDFISLERPCLVDEFLDRALELDVDLVRGPDWSVIGGIVEHIEAAGVHSGDSMGVLPPQRLKEEIGHKVEVMAKALADELNILGFLNLQLALRNDEIYILEANPRSSRSVPFIAKATGIPLVDLGVLGLLGQPAHRLNLAAINWRNSKDVSVKGVVFPFKKLSESDSILGPEMKSTGESMGRGADYSEALLKAFVSSHVRLPQPGEVFLSLRDKDKSEMLPVIRDLKKMGFTFSATGGTAAFLNQNQIECEAVKKVHEGRPHCVDRIRSGQVRLVINTTSGRQSIEASFGIRRSCIDYFVPCLTESDAAASFILALQSMNNKNYRVQPLSALDDIMKL